MITRIEATRYRCLEKLDADLGEYTVLAGANGAGKTTFLDIPVLLGDLLRQRDVAAAFTERIDDRPARATTLQDLVFCGQGDTFGFAVEAKLPEAVVRDLLDGASDAVKADNKKWPSRLRYELRFQIFNKRELNVQNEYLFIFPDTAVPTREQTRFYGDGAEKRDWRFVLRREYGGDAQFRVETKPSAKAKGTKVEASLLALPRVQFESAADYPAARWFHDHLTVGCVFYSPDINALRTASPPGLPTTIMPSARNLPWLAHELASEQPQEFKAWVDHVRTALPQISNIETREREEDHHAYFIVTYNHDYAVTSSGLSEGTLRVLSLTLLPYLIRQPALLVTEEPETGIHPRAIETVLQSLSSMYHSQVLISTHSPVVLAHTKLQQLLCARIVDHGAVEMVPGPNHPRLKEWHGSADLGNLFAAGVLG